MRQNRQSFPDDMMRHGGDLDEAEQLFGPPPGGWLDMSTGVNPRPYPIGAIEPALRRLPSRRGLDALIAGAREAYGAGADLAVAATPGTEVLIRMLPTLAPGPWLLADTSYGSYSEAFAGSGRLRMIAAEAVADQSDASVALVNPNNPDGRILDGRTVLSVIRGRARGRITAIDEAYADCEPNASVVQHLRADDRAVVFRSFGKFFGLPGLRLGFAIGAPDLVERIARTLGDWPVSGAAIAVGTPALADEDWKRQARHWLGNQAQALDSVLRKSGLGLADGCRLFRVVNVPDAAAVHDRLARHGIWTRIFADRPTLIRFGLPGSADDLKRLAAALDGR